MGEYTIQGVCNHFHTVQSCPPVTVTLAETAPTTAEPGKDESEKKDEKGKDEKKENKG